MMKLLRVFLIVLGCLIALIIMITWLKVSPPWANDETGLLMEKNVGGFVFRAKRSGGFVTAPSVLKITAHRSNAILPWKTTIVNSDMGDSVDVYLIAKDTIRIDIFADQYQPQGGTKRLFFKSVLIDIAHLPKEPIKLEYP